MKRLRNIGCWPVVIVGLLGGVGWYLDATFHTDKPARRPNQQLSPREKEAVRQQAVARANVHLDQLHDECRRLVTQHLNALSHDFVQAKTRTPQFADDVLGWQSKWSLLTDQIPFIGTDHAHSRFVEESFGRNLFTKEDIERAAARTVASLRADVEGLEGDMLVRLRHDLVVLPGNWPFEIPGKTPWDRWVSELQVLNDEAAVQCVTAEIVQILVSTLLAETAVRLANRTGVSAAILGSSAAGSKASFGTSLLLGVAADQIVGWTWDTIADTRGHLIRQLNTGIDELHRELVEGTETTSGLRQRLEQMTDDRDRVRRAAVLNSVAGQGGD